MKAVQIQEKGDPSTLVCVDVPTPATGPDEILIRVHASGVNFADVLARQGLYPDAPPMPFIPGYEVSGTVAATGKNVTGFKEHDRVAAFTRFGGYAEYAVAPEMAVMPIPENISFTDAAGIPVVFTTAYHSLFQTGTMMDGFNVLIHAAAGGVGQAAVQLCKLHNCTIFGTAGSRDKMQLLKKLGVHYPINYRTADFHDEIQKIMPGAQLDIILDCIGGDSIMKGIKLLKPHGRIIIFGFATVSGKNWAQIAWSLFRMKKINPIALLARSRGVYGVNILHVFEQNPAVALDSFHKIFQLLEQGDISASVSSIFPLEHAAKAHSLLQQRKSQGKLILVPESVG